MVIQRWQSVLLFLAVIAIVVFCSMPFAIFTQLSCENSSIYPVDAPVLLTVAVLIGVLQAISIFMYKNLKRQMTVTLVSIVLAIAAIITCAFVTYDAYNSGADLKLFGGITPLVVNMVLAICAYRLMGNDLRKLRSYDRLR